MPLDVLVPQDLQRDVLALQLAVNQRPVGLGAAPMPLLLADGGEEQRLQRRVSQLSRLYPIILQAWLTLPSCLASSGNPTLARMIFCSCVIVVSLTPQGGPRSRLL